MTRCCSSDKLLLHQLAAHKKSVHADALASHERISKPLPQLHKCIQTRSITTRSIESMVRVVRHHPTAAWNERGIVFNDNHSWLIRPERVPYPIIIAIN